VKILAGVRQSDVVDTVLNFAAVAVVLPFDACGMVAALDGSRLVDASDRINISVLRSHDTLAAISKKFFVPLDRLQESLQRSGGDILFHGHCFNVFSLYVAEQTPDVDGEQSSPRKTRETLGKESQELGKQCSE